MSGPFCLEVSIKEACQRKKENSVAVEELEIHVRALVCCQDLRCR
jgi:hypothetical protein